MQASYTLSIKNEIRISLWGNNTSQVPTYIRHHKDILGESMTALVRNRTVLYLYDKFTFKAKGYSDICEVVRWTDPK